MLTTRFIEKIISEGKYYFLGRPRRFWKSLFLSTLKCFFEGRRELFKGYVIELKADSTPEKALRQIDDKEYPLQFATDNRQVIKIGANFSTDTRRLTGYLIAR